MGIRQNFSQAQLTGLMRVHMMEPFTEDRMDGSTRQQLAREPTHLIAEYTLCYTDAVPGLKASRSLVVTMILLRQTTSLWFIQTFNVGITRVTLIQKDSTLTLGLFH